MPDSTPRPSIILHKFEELCGHDLMQREPSIGTLERERPVVRPSQGFLNSPTCVHQDSSCSIWNDSLAWSINGVSDSKPSMVSLLPNIETHPFPYKLEANSSELLSQPVQDEISKDLNDITLVYVLKNDFNPLFKKLC
jgi:hypothetical protein